MALVKKSREAVGIEVIQTNGDADVITGAYATLGDAVKDILVALKDGERGRLTIVKAIDQISQLELYTQEGFGSMAAYMPKLFELCNEVSWKSASSVKHSLTWYRLYIKALEYDPNEALKAISHLGILARLADMNRKTNELAEDDNLEKAKLGRVKFDDLGRLVVRLVAGFSNNVIFQVLGSVRLDELQAKVKAPAGATPKQIIAASGLPREELFDLLDAVGLGASVDTYEGVTGKELVLPAGRWLTAHTQEIVDALVKKEEEADDTVQVYIGYEPFGGGVVVERIEYRNAEGIVLVTIQVGETLTSEMFKRISKGAVTEIAGEEGD